MIIHNYLYKIILNNLRNIQRFYNSKYKYLIVQNAQDKLLNVLSFTSKNSKCFLPYKLIKKNQIKNNFQKQQEQTKNDLKQKDVEWNSQTSHFFNYNDLVQSLKVKHFKKISFLNGAGISVAAGIPDFRSPKTGIYWKLQHEQNIDPDEVFYLESFKFNPSPFYKFNKLFLNQSIKPVNAHYFQSFLHHLNLLHYVFTQNIDSLELEAGVPQEKVKQAHGHLYFYNFVYYLFFFRRNVYCVKCKAENSLTKYIEKIKNMSENDKLKIKCENCKMGYVKPAIILFGEDLPHDYLDNTFLLQESDLVFIMGTSLSIYPFSQIIENINFKTPVVVINKY